MNKTAIKNFAIWARVQLIEAAKQRAYEYEITDGGENKAGLETIGGRLLSKTEREQRNQLIAEINRKSFLQVMEEAAYTWFNRFIALRFMEVNGYLPSKVRVFTDENGTFKPEILKQAISVELEGLDRSKVLDLLDKQDNEELFKYLLITQCNALNVGLPYMFEKIGGWTELLFPANLLRQDSVIGQMISTIPEEDWTDAVQIIGWMYQYYNSELKDETFALLKKNVKITKERIPAATQLFTPDWIVRYMVENSLGRLWYEGHPDFDKSPWKYYLDEAAQDPEVEAQLQKIRGEYSSIRPEEIKVIDPCMGSGHILVYAFDVLMQIYISAGWSERDAAKSILENNLFGLDIDDRAGQLAYFAVMMKARKYSRRILNGEVKPNVLSIQDSNWMTDEFIAYVAGKDMTMRANLVMLRKAFCDAKEYGSILNVQKIDFDALYERIDIINRSYAEDLFQAQYRIMAVEQLLPLVRQSQIMSQRNDVVVTNPPYMGSSSMSGKLGAFVKINYPDSKNDLFAVFIERCGQMTKKNGYQAMITQHAWMFLSSFEKLRAKLMSNDTVNMAHLGARAFEEIGGEVVQTTSFVLRHSNIHNYMGTYCRLITPTTQVGKEEMFLSGENRYISKQDNFFKVPGKTIAYWASNTILDSFSDETAAGKYADFRHGMSTSDNNKYLRLWFEPSIDNIGFRCESRDQTKQHKWYVYLKGGSFRRWYGNFDYVVNWQDDGKEIKEVSNIKYPYLKGNLDFVLGGQMYFFKPGYTWSSLTTGKLGIRKFGIGCIFDAKGQCYFPYEKKYGDVLLAFYNSVVFEKYGEILSPTLDFNSGVISKAPIILDEQYLDRITDLVVENVAIAKQDWDSFETSWEYKRHPLVFDLHLKTEYKDSQWASDRLSKCSSLEWLFETWRTECNDRFSKLQSNEEELNRILIEMYGLQDEVTPDVEDRDVTVRKADLQREIKSLISYAVGCMFGRYSIDAEGLCYASGEWDASKYKTIIPDDDNIIPICDDDYFDDDIVGKFVDFVRKVYGEETLEQNLRFIADALGGKGTSREVIRNYFLNDFFVDHCSTYSVSGSGKRPIYWLFSSGKKNGFKALIYMHRYQPDLLARMRTDYVHEQQERYRTQLQMLEISSQSATPSERVKLNKQIAKLNDQALEIQRYEEKIHHLADRMISIDLDDGVKANYAKFQDVLEKIK